MPPDETYEQQGHQQVYADADGTLHAGGAPVDLKVPATIDLSDLPDADPEVVGQAWLDGGVLTVSAGPPPPGP